MKSVVPVILLGLLLNACASTVRTGTETPGDPDWIRFSQADECEKLDLMYDYSLRAAQSLGTISGMIGYFEERTGKQGHYEYFGYFPHYYDSSIARADVRMWGEGLPCNPN